ncbi:MAG: hypothetical protein CME28_07505 [Gemmatimonadetes bacterium]|nr:hypothetical protein [Gemmatimonadota bacterium]
MTSATLVPMGTLTAQIGDMIEVGDGPKGKRISVDVPEITLKGDDLSASLAINDAADWLTLSGPDDQLGTLDVRFTLKTDDGAFIYVEYGGRADMRTNLIVSTPTFQTGDERYLWLNKVQAIGAGKFNPDTGILVYQLYKVDVLED